MASEGVIRKLVTLWGFEIDAKPLEKIDAKVDKVKGKFEAIGKQISVAGLGLFGLAAFTARAGDETSDLAETLDVSVRQLQKLRGAANVAGVDVDKFTAGLLFMKRQSSEAADGNKETAVMFRRLGVSMRDLKTRDTTQLLEKLSVGLSKVRNQNDRLRYSNELFGRGNYKMLLLLQKGPAEMRRYMAEAEKLGAVMGKDDVKAADQFYKNMVRVKMVLTGLRNIAGSYLIPMFNELAVEFMNYVKANRELIKQNIQAFLKGVVAAFKALFAAIRAVLPYVKETVQALGGMEKTVKLLIYAWAALKIVSITVQVIGLLKAIKGFAVANPSTWAIIAGIAMIGILIDDIVAFVQGRKSVIGVVFKSIKEIITWIREGIQDIADAITRIMEKIPQLKPLADFIKGGKLDANGKMSIENYSPGQQKAIDWLEDARLTVRNMLGVQTPFASERGGMIGGVPGNVNNFAPHTTVIVQGGSAEHRQTADNVAQVVRRENERLRREFLRDAQGGIKY